MGEYAQAPEFYDLLYRDQKDYAAEAELLRALIRAAHPTARTILDVGCGTGSHARALIDAGFRVDGVDIEPAFVAIARAKCPEGRFGVADMATLDLPARYDVVTCLFSAIGYVRTEHALPAATLRMAAHLNPGGLLVIDPWFEPGQLTHGYITTVIGKSEDVTVCRMSRTLVDGPISRLEFEYLIGTAGGIERRSEVHELRLFTQGQMEAAFRDAGLNVERKPEALRTRGLYVGREARPAATVASTARDPRAGTAGYYDLSPDHFDDAPFYLARIPSPAARVLELGCGTGRVSVALATAAGAFAGVDHSAEMAARCRERLAAAGLAPERARVEIADIVEFDLGETFDLIVAPYRVFQNLETDEQVHGLFECIRRHLAPGGRCILNAFRPKFPPDEVLRRWATPDESEAWSVPVPDGRVVCIERKAGVRGKPLTLYPQLVCRRFRGEELVDEAVLAIAMRCWYPDELLARILAEGYNVTGTWGGYHGERWDDGQELIVEFAAEG